jgi:hypothetical protein
MTHGAMQRFTHCSLRHEYEVSVQVHATAALSLERFPSIDRMSSCADPGTIPDDVEEEKTLAPIGTPTPHSPSQYQSVYRLPYPGS